ncbi:23S rRNA (guanine(745)-N(1))-methyltransferase [Methylococcaceae bacterium HT1]|nr:23S rRNA (guanine(745)-N(1))-methyltransferase [Methylococcaceae bacterium HT1]TXL22159.1 23S rRNA (guanine(745)-N(1))-methyltransferase [Methylococcaceae bacterium HT2]
MPYICPICQNPLMQHLPSKGYYCTKKHHFDQAKEGYLNLLPAQHKKSKEPGDSRAMMRARRNFLEAGFYQPMAQALTNIIEKHRPETIPMNILDVGCGEGYYCRQIESLAKNPEDLNLHGIDIAKNAIFAAAKKQKNARFIVASSKSMPYADEYFDLLFRVYAPSDAKEMARLLKPSGLLLIVTPGPRHLWQLKEFIYTNVKEHSIDVPLPTGFSQIESQRVSFNIQPDQDQRMALLQMTPFAWRANAATQNKIQHAKDLIIETDFILTLASR